MTEIERRRQRINDAVREQLLKRNVDGLTAVGRELALIDIQLSLTALVEPVVVPVHIGDFIVFWLVDPLDSSVQA